MRKLLAPRSAQRELSTTPYDVQDGPAAAILHEADDTLGAIDLGRKPLDEPPQSAGGQGSLRSDAPAFEHGMMITVGMLVRSTTVVAVGVVAMDVVVPLVHRGAGKHARTRIRLSKENLARDSAECRGIDASTCHDTLNRRFQLPQCGGIDEIYFVEYDDICRLELSGGHDPFTCTHVKMVLGVHHDQHGIEPHEISEPGSIEAPGDGGGIRDTTGFDHDVLGRLRARHQALHGHHELIAKAAADAPIGEVDGIAVEPYDQLGVNVDLAEVVDDDADASAVRAVQKMIEDGGLARSKEATQDRD